MLKSLRELGTWKVPASVLLGIGIFNVLYVGLGTSAAIPLAKAHADCQRSAMDFTMTDQAFKELMEKCGAKPTHAPVTSR